MKWIDAIKNPPTEEKHYLAIFKFYDGFRDIRVGPFYKDKPWNEVTTTSKITHYMHLPELPNEVD